MVSAASASACSKREVRAEGSPNTKYYVYQLAAKERAISCIVFVGAIKCWRSAVHPTANGPAGCMTHA